MNASPTVDVTWSVREYSLVPQAVAACGVQLSRALANRLMKRQLSDLQKLQCVAGNGVFLVLGDELEIPWLDGVVYLGQERHTTIYVPTILQPSVPISLLERALLAAHPTLKPPIAVLPTVSIIVSLSKPFIPDYEKLESCLEKL